MSMAVCGELTRRLSVRYGRSIKRLVVWLCGMAWRGVALIVYTIIARRGVRLEMCATCL